MGGLAALGLPFARSQPANSSPVVFPQGVASGDPSDSGAVLWTRVNPAVYQAGEKATLEISLTPDFAKLTFQSSVAVDPASDCTLQIDIAGLLEPATVYFYRFRYRDAYSPPGRSKTLPAADDIRPLRLGLVSCQEFTSGYYGAYAHLAQEDLDAVVHLGDLIYETSADPRYRKPKLEGRTFSLPSGSYMALGLADYRLLYQAYRDPFMQAAMAAHPFLAMWDDHEFANDCYWDESLNAPGAPNHPYKNQPEKLRALRQAANQAWREYVPSRVAFDPQTVQMPVYRSVRMGGMLELFLTDDRTFRSPHACGEDNRALTNCAAQDDARRSMFGSAQEAWLLEGLSASNARWRALGSAVMFSPLKAAGLTLNQDGWDGYEAERERIIQGLKEQKANNVLVLSGDLHAALASRIDPIGMEFMTPAISSPNARDSLSSRYPWPGNGLVEFLNPHLSFFDGETNGYSVLELSSEKVVYKLYSVDKTVNSANAPKRLVRTVEWSG